MQWTIHKYPVLEDKQIGSSQLIEDNSRPPQEYDQAVDADVYRTCHEDESRDLTDAYGRGRGGVVESLGGKTKHPRGNASNSD